MISEYIIQEDLTKAARKVGEAKKHESKFTRSRRFRLVADTADFLSQAGVFGIADRPDCVMYSTSRSVTRTLSLEHIGASAQLHARLIL